MSNQPTTYLGDQRVEKTIDTVLAAPAGATARAALRSRLNEARQEVANAIDWLKTYTEVRDEAQKLVDELEAALVDLDAIAPEDGTR